MIEQLPDKQANKNLRTRTPATIASDTAGLFRLKARETALMEAYPFEDLLQLLAAGRTQREIARITGANLSTVSTWLATQQGARAQAISEARKASAGACMDKALQALEDVNLDNPVAATVGKDLARHWERRAALYDRAAYHDKGALVDQQTTHAQPPSFSITILSGSQGSQTITIDQQSAQCLPSGQGGQDDLI